MKIAIVGIGGIGGFIGAKLAKKYSEGTNHSVTFIQRGKHGQAIQENGLNFIGKKSEVIKPNNVYSNFYNNDIFDLIIVSTKSKDLEQTIESFKNNLHNSSVVVTLLNGVNNANRIQAILPKHRVLQGCIYVSAAIKHAGCVVQKGGAGNVFIGPENSSITIIDKEIETIFNDAGIKTILSEQITLEMWKKYLFIETFATMTSAYNMGIGEVVRDNNLLNETKNLIQETISLANKLNIPLRQEHASSAIELALIIPQDTPTSMQLDVYSSKQPEIDVLTGYIVTESKKQSIFAPLHEKLYKKIICIIESQIHG